MAHDGAARDSPTILVHPATVRVTHWVNAVAILCMIMSGWAIYNASPLFPFTFPREVTLGGWLGGAIAWHFAMMWLLVLNGLVYVIYGVLSGHFARALLPLSPRALLRDLGAALTFRLRHKAGVYNAVQKACYVAVLAAGIVIVVSGLALWKPVQLPFADLLGGYELTRRIHFIAMAGIVLFIILHLVLVAIVPRTLLSMITGRARVTDHHEAGA